MPGPGMTGGAESRMKKFFVKYGKPAVFAMMVILCASFLIQLLAIGDGYRQTLDTQAAERASSYAMEQALGLEDQFRILKLKAQFYAGEVEACAMKSDAIALLMAARSEIYGSDRENFSDIFYCRDGVLYTLDGEVKGGYPELTEAIDGVSVSRVFQYDNTRMSFGVSAPVETSFADRIVLLYARTAVSLYDWIRDEDGQRLTSVSAASFLLLCKHDGVILERQVNSDEINPGNDPVQIGLFRQILNDEEALRRVNALAAGGAGTEAVQVGASRYLLTVYSFGAEDGGMFLVGLYPMQNLYGSGYNLMNTIWEMLALVGIILVVFVVVFIIDRVQVSRTVSKLTTVDTVLDCFTAAGFEGEAQDILDQHRTTQFAIVILKVNNFSYLNEKFGEARAREVLQYIRNVCNHTLILAETYGYMEDGQFLLLLHYKDRKALTSRLNGLYSLIAQYRGLPDSSYQLNISYCIYEVEREEHQTVHRMIDKAKMVDTNTTLGRGMVSFDFYGDMLRENYLRKAEIEGRMQSALENNEFHLFYQPKYNLKKGRMDGSEILVRWFDAKIDRYRTPAEFLPIFEENGFINKIDRFVFYRACENMAEMVRKNQPVYPVSVNVSRVTAIQPDFVSYYIRIKQKFDIRDGMVTLEFTESFAYDNYEYLSSVIGELHRAGFQCSLDDFGTGYSSFVVLKILDLDEIKIDKSLLERTEHPDRDRVLLESMIGMSLKLGTKVTQEGVETAEEFRMLEKMGCDVIQGYYFAKPMKYVDYREFLNLNFNFNERR